MPPVTLIRNIVAAVLTVALLGLVVVSVFFPRKQSRPGATSNPAAPKQLEIVCPLYQPGTRPTGIGEPLSAFRQLADEYEQQHPDVGLSFLPVAMVGGEEEWIKTQLTGGIAPHIVNANAEVVWPDVDKGWWISLEPYLNEPNPYVPGNEQWWDLFYNQALTRAKRAPNGELYCIPLDLIETGLVYNKDIFRKVGVEVPETWAEFLDVQQKLQDAGYVPLIMSLTAIDWAHDVLFDQLFYELTDELDVIPSSEDARGYLTHYLFPNELCYNIQRGAFDGERYKEVWRLMHQWRQYWNKELLNSDNIRLFLMQRGAIFWTSSVLIPRFRQDPYMDFDWDVFYLPPITRETSPYACGVEASVIGGAAVQLSVTNRTKQEVMVDGKPTDTLDDAVDFLRYITAPDNAAQLIGDAGMFFPNIRGATQPPGLEPFAEIIKRRYCMVKWSYSLNTSFKDKVWRLYPLFLNDGITLDEMHSEMNRLMHTSADTLLAEAEDRALQEARAEYEATTGKPWTAAMTEQFRQAWTMEDWLAQGRSM